MIVLNVITPMLADEHRPWAPSRAMTIPGPARFQVLWRFACAGARGCAPGRDKSEAAGMACRRPARRVSRHPAGHRASAEDLERLAYAWTGRQGWGGRVRYSRTWITIRVMNRTERNSEVRIGADFWRAACMRSGGFGTALMQRTEGRRRPIAHAHVPFRQPATYRAGRIRFSLHEYTLKKK
jgi:hypothetical protein